MARAYAGKFNEYDRHLFWGLVVLLLLTLAAYLYFLSRTVFAVVERNHAEKAIVATTANLSTLETKFVALDQNIDLALAHQKGFIDINQPTYITIAVPKQSLSLRTGNEQ